MKSPVFVMCLFCTSLALAGTTTNLDMDMRFTALQNKCKANKGVPSSKLKEVIKNNSVPENWSAKMADESVAWGRVIVSQLIMDKNAGKDPNCDLTEDDKNFLLREKAAQKQVAQAAAAGKSKDEQDNIRLAAQGAPTPSNSSVVTLSKKAPSTSVAQAPAPAAPSAKSDKKDNSSMLAAAAPLLMMGMGGKGGGGGQNLQPPGGAGGKPQNSHAGQAGPTADQHRPDRSAGSNTGNPGQNGAQGGSTDLGLASAQCSIEILESALCVDAFQNAQFISKLIFTLTAETYYATEAIHTQLFKEFSGSIDSSLSNVMKDPKELAKLFGVNIQAANSSESENQLTKYRQIIEQKKIASKNATERGNLAYNLSYGYKLANAWWAYDRLHKAISTNLINLGCPAVTPPSAPDSPAKCEKSQVQTKLTATQSVLLEKGGNGTLLAIGLDGCYNEKEIGKACEDETETLKGCAETYDAEALELESQKETIGNVAQQLEGGQQSKFAKFVDQLIGKSPKFNHYTFDNKDYIATLGNSKKSPLPQKIKEALAKREREYQGQKNAAASCLKLPQYQPPVPPNPPNPYYTQYFACLSTIQKTLLPNMEPLIETLKKDNDKLSKDYDEVVRGGIDNIVNLRNKTVQFTIADLGAAKKSFELIAEALGKVHCPSKPPEAPPPAAADRPKPPKKIKPPKKMEPPTKQRPQTHTPIHTGNQFIDAPTKASEYDVNGHHITIDRETNTFTDHTENIQNPVGPVNPTKLEVVPAQSPDTSGAPTNLDQPSAIKPGGNGSILNSNGHLQFPSPPSDPPPGSSSGGTNYYDKGTGYQIKINGR